MALKAQQLGVELVLGKRVAKVEFKGPAVVDESGEVFEADLVIAADGLWSRCRESFLGRPDSPLPTGDLAYRILLSVDQISDPELLSIVQNPQVRFWIGNESHVVGYSLRSGTMYNLVLLVPDNLPESVSKQEGSVEEMRKLFENWDPL
jgi:salicylate hydroxylase